MKWVTARRRPYSALTAMAIDPIYISLRELPEFIAWGGESAIEDEETERLGGCAGRTDPSITEPCAS